MLAPYKEYLLQRWNAGCCDALRLFKALQQHEYRGSYSAVARYTRRLRQAQGLVLRPYRRGGVRPEVAEPKKRRLTVHRAT